MAALSSPEQLNIIKNLKIQNVVKGSIFYEKYLIDSV